MPDHDWRWHKAETERLLDRSGEIAAAGSAALTAIGGES